MPAISVVIPTLNEAKELPETLRRAKSLDGLKEIIVVDAGSSDSTQDIAREAGCMTVECEPSRGRQLRLGAELAKGEIVLLLHADTWLPENAASIISETLAKPGVIAGAFYKRFRDRGALPGSRIRCWLLWKFANKFFGDQAIFVERSTLEQVGGIPNVPIMEEFELCKIISPLGRLTLVNNVVKSSARRMFSEGAIKTYGRMIICSIGFFLGVSPRKLSGIYYSKESME